VPHVEGAIEALRQWRDNHAATYFGLHETRCALLSCSLTADQLQELADEAGDFFLRASVEQVLLIPDAPARVSTQLATFSDGLAELPSWDASDREYIVRGTGARQGLLRTRFQLQSKPLPRSPSLAGQASWDPGWWGGGYEVQTRTDDELVQVVWPAGFTVIRALARDHGLDPRPSAAGRVAVAFLRRMGHLEAVRAFLALPVIELFERLGERSGMTWFKDRVRALTGIAEDAAGDDRQRLDAIEAALARIAASEDDPERRSITARAVEVDLGRSLAHRWLAACEEMGVLVRGIELRCETCTARSWRAVGELAPPIVCRSCGMGITKPFPDRLEFKYRASETLLRVIEHDALVHVIAMHWFDHLMRGPRRSGFYGAHPGVEFVDGDTPIGEADVVLVSSDGSFVLGECKRRGAGLSEREVEKFKRLEQHLDAAWSFFATLDWAERCPQTWADVQRALPERPCFALSGERLLEAFPVWTLGENPMSFAPEDESAHSQRLEQFRERTLPFTLDWLSGTRGAEENLLCWDA
jgi:hypothetical protein